MDDVNGQFVGALQLTMVLTAALQGYGSDLESEVAQADESQGQDPSMMMDIKQGRRGTNPFFFFLVGSTSFPEKRKRPTPEELGSIETPINVDNFQIIGDQIVKVINLTRDMVSPFQLNFILHITHLCRRTCVPQTCPSAVH